MQKTEKINCRHCDCHIGNKHIFGNEQYRSNQIIVPRKMGLITKTKVRGTSQSERWGDMGSAVGYTLEVQLTCKRCNKKTTTTAQNDC